MRLPDGLHGVVVVVLIAACEAADDFASRAKHVQMVVWVGGAGVSISFLHNRDLVL